MSINDVQMDMPRIPLYARTHSQLFVPIEPSIRGMAYQVTCAAHYRSVLSI